VDLYRSIASYYDEIFPLDPAKAPFVQALVPKSSQSILDLGCSTGALALALSRSGHRVTGIDLNRGMIDIAKARAAGENLDVRFHVMDMLHIEEHFESASMDQLLCFGNTLVHLSGREEIESLCRTVYRLIDGGGVFVAQILNYDRILDKRITRLPIIESDVFRFDRSYRHEGEQRILFETELELKETRQIYSDVTSLFPLRWEAFERILKSAGFRDLRFYSGYDGKEYSLEDFALIAVGRK
jgi:SAM-dependent methyltransferase